MPPSDCCLRGLSTGQVTLGTAQIEVGVRQDARRQQHLVDVQVVLPRGAGAALRPQPERRDRVAEVLETGEPLDLARHLSLVHPLECRQADSETELSKPQPMLGGLLEIVAMRVCAEALEGRLEQPIPQVASVQRVSLPELFDTPAVAQQPAEA